MYSILALGLVVRIWHASGTYLNPDEALHFFVANKTTWWETYRASLNVSHPPLLIFLLRVWRVLGTSELMLRLPSILAGMVFCWFAYRWLRMLFDESVVWIAFSLIVFLPSSIDLSTEVRQYALLLAFAMGSAYFLERALRENSALAMLVSGVFLWLAILSHFSAFLFAGVLGVYAILRMLEKRTPLKVLLAFAISYTSPRSRALGRPMVVPTQPRDGWATIISAIRITFPGESTHCYLYLRGREEYFSTFSANLSWEIWRFCCLS